MFSGSGTLSGTSTLPHTFGRGGNAFFSGAESNLFNRVSHGNRYPSVFGASLSNTGDFADMKVDGSVNNGMMIFSPHDEKVNHNTGQDEILFSCNIETTPRYQQLNKRLNHRNKPQHVKTVSALNSYLDSSLGRKEFGHHQISTPLMKAWSMVGMQKTDDSHHVGDLGTLAMTVHVARRAKIANLWIHHTSKSISDKLASERSRKRKDILQSGISGPSYMKGAGMVTEDSRCYFLVVRQYAPFSDLIGNKRPTKKPKYTYSGLKTNLNPRTGMDDTPPGDYRWQFVPWFTSAGEPNQNEYNTTDVMDPDKSFTGTFIYVGAVTRLYGPQLPRNPNPSMKLDRNAKALLRPEISDTGIHKHRSLINDSPKIEIQLRCK
jgi:hypothetical protein